MNSDVAAMLNIPIVIAAYNRGNTLTRLLSSLAKAYYPAPVKLIISIDGGGSDSVKKIAEEFDWQHGQKEIIAHPENLGLRRHILSCGDLSSQYDGIILLEDDLFVSPRFYQYTLAALQFYKECPEICGLSLYSYQYNETALFPFKPLNDGSDAYFMQLPCSWGQTWLKEHWAGFSSWYADNSAASFQDDSSLPANIAFWPDTSWKKYFLKYMVETNKFFVYPHLSHTTNFGDKGQHHQGTNVFQVPLASGDSGDYCFKPFADCLVKYDVFCELLPDCLKSLSGGTLPAELSVDLYGSKRSENLTGEYVLTSKQCRSYQESFGRQMTPQEMNIINRIEGADLFLARKDQLEECGDIHQYIYGKASSEAAQRYYFGTDDVHHARLHDVESRLEQAERVIGSNRDLLTYSQQTETQLRDCQTKVAALHSSLSWRITKPLRKLGDWLRAQGSGGKA